jgi:hypothetical protein
MHKVDHIIGKHMKLQRFLGAFRMREIGKGQTIHLLIIPEIERTIRRELSKCDMTEVGFNSYIYIFSNYFLSDSLFRLDTPHQNNYIMYYWMWQHGLSLIQCTLRSYINFNISKSLMIGTEGSIPSIVFAKCFQYLAKKFFSSNYG